MDIEFPARLQLRLPARFQMADIIQVEVRLADENGASVVYASMQGDTGRDAEDGHAVFGCFEWSFSEQVADAIRAAASAAQQAMKAAEKLAASSVERSGPGVMNNRLRAAKKKMFRDPPPPAVVAAIETAWACNHKPSKTALVAELDRLLAAYRTGGRPAAQAVLDTMLGERQWLQLELTVLLGRFRQALLTLGVVPPRGLGPDAVVPAIEVQ